MNKVILMGRLARDPDVRYSGNGDKRLCVSRYTLAVNRRMVKENEQNADFISCVAFGKAGEFTEKYFRKGMRVVISGRIQTGSYTNRDGQRVFTTDVVVEDQEFAESKSSGHAQEGPDDSEHRNDDFVSIPEDINDESLPFN